MVNRFTIAKIPLFLFLILLFQKNTFASHYPLDALEFIDPEQAKKLESLGIEDSKSLYELSKERKKFNLVLKKLRIKRSELKKWISFCDLLRIEGIGPKVAKVLTIARIKNTRILAKQTADLLLKKIVKINKKHEILGKIPSIETVENWIEQAKNLKKLKD